MDPLETTTSRTLETVMRFAAARQRVLAHDLANLSTPGFRPVDVSVDAFQESLRDAIDRARQGAAPFAPQDSETVRFVGQEVVLKPRPRSENILFHDRTDADGDRLLSDLAENVLAFRAAAELHRHRTAQILSAIRERP
ncbi:MAG: hypothetical protein KF724_09690 [Phycisphaeraceae bacterium]|nr:hypothetical protein [Phycisphaeraceae bacterium]